MISRRKFVQQTTATTTGYALTGTGWLGGLAHAQAALLDPLAQPKFVNALPVPERVQSKDAKKPITGTIKESDEFLGLYDKKGKKLKTTIWGYDFGDVKVVRKGSKGMLPGATIVAQRNTLLSVKWENKIKEFDLKKLAPWEAHLLPMDKTTHQATPITLPKIGVPTVTHLHGGHTEAASDGYPEAWFTKKFDETGPAFTQQIYTYHNDQEAACLWYHDHALGITRLNVYAGLAGFYLLRDAIEDGLVSRCVLPADDYEQELMIQDRMFTADGQLFMPADGAPEETVSPVTGLPFLSLPPGPSINAEFFGDVIQVNGMAWPVMDVEPRKYRFRVLNASDSRFYVFKLSNGAPFLQVGADQSLFAQAVNVSELLLAPSERADIVIDFSRFAGAQIKLQNVGPDAPFQGFEAGGVIGGAANPATTGQIMMFRVNQRMNTNIAEASVRHDTILKAPLVKPKQTGITRKVVLFEGLDEYGRLQPMLGTLAKGSMTWHEPVTETPRLNDVEVWEIYNTTMDAHPIHLHLISFQVLSRQGFNGNVIQKVQHQHDGTQGVGGQLLANSIGLVGSQRGPEANEIGRKDTVVAYPGEVTRVITSPFDRRGTYVWHCHILSHEDHDMMRPLRVV